MRISEDEVPNYPDFVICQWYSPVGECQAELIRKDDLVTGAEVASIEIQLGGRRGK